MWSLSSSVFHRSDEWGKKNEDNDCMPLSSCLRGIRTRGENDNDLCDHHFLFFFKGATIGEKKDTKKNKGEKKQDMNVVMKHCSSALHNWSTL